MKNTRKRKYTHAVIYIGAPHGDDEDGHIVSRHTSETLAVAAARAKFGGTTGAYCARVVPLRPDGSWSRR